MKLYAVADLFEPRVQNSLKNLRERAPDKVDVPPDRQFVGFDAYGRRLTASVPATSCC